MITIINATNRADNKTQIVVQAYADLLADSGESFQVLSMNELPVDFTFTANYGQKHEVMEALVHAKIIGADKLVVVSPEYNGSFPGVFKAFIDAVHPKHFKGKKAALVGVATGRAGNLRGMDHLTDVLHHLGVEVLSRKVPISKLDDLVQNNVLVDNETKTALRKQFELLRDF